MTKVAALLSISVIAVAFPCAIGYAQEADELRNADRNIERIENALKELAMQKELSPADRDLRKSMEQSLKRLKASKASLKEAKSDLKQSNENAQKVLKQFGDKAFALAQEAFRRKDFAKAAELLNQILETDPENPEAEKLFEKILPSISPPVYRQRWSLYSLINRKRSAREGVGNQLWTSVYLALRWLFFHQDKDGKWGQDGFDKHCDTRRFKRCKGHGTGQYDVGVTGLALLAYMGAGYTHRAGDFKKTVKKGLDWLLSQQQEDGQFGQRGAVESWIYNHAIATQALCEAYAMTRDPRLKEPAKKAVDFILKAQNPGLGWKYKPKSGRSDSSVTGWMVLALHAAKTAGLKVPDTAFEGAIKWFDRMTNAAGKCGYMRPGDPGTIKRIGDHWKSLPSTTGVSVLCRLLCGQSRKDTKVQKGFDILMANLPDWNKPTNPKVDMYYWFWGTYAMFQHGGKKWHRWNKKMKEALHNTQRQGGCPDGSWNPVGKWGMVGGRVYATAINCLTLEVYYRHSRVGSEERKSPDKK